MREDEIKRIERDMKAKYEKTLVSDDRTHYITVLRDDDIFIVYYDETGQYEEYTHDEYEKFEVERKNEGFHVEFEEVE